MGNPCARINESGYDIELIFALADRGFNIGIDTWSNCGKKTKNATYALDVRKKLLIDLIERGYADCITLGHDMKSRADGVQNGASGYVLWPNVVNDMKNTGEISQEVYKKLTEDNPRRILTVA